MSTDYDRGTNADMDPANTTELVATLDRIPELRRRLESLSVGAPLVGSGQFEDLLIPRFGVGPTDIVSLKLSLALDHLHTWRALVVDAHVLPTWAHLTLLRPVYEASIQARWILSWTSAPVRVGRALGFRIASLRWAEKLEPDLAALGWTGPPTAGKRAAELIAAAAEVSVVPVVPEDTTALARKFSIEGDARDVVHFRYLSGVLHSQVWATLQGDTETLSSGGTFPARLTAANERVAIAITTTAVHQFSAAVDAFAVYLDPKAKEPD